MSLPSIKRDLNLTGSQIARVVRYRNAPLTEVPMRDHHYYDLNISEEDRERALSSVKALFETLDSSPMADAPMQSPTLAFSAYEVEIDEYDEMQGGDYLLVFDIESLTAGKLRHLTPRHLKTLLFNADVFDVVVSAMSDVFHWIADEEFLGSTPTNERGITTALEVIVQAVVDSIATRLVRAPGH
jgi:hypothetical protein